MSELARAINGTLNSETGKFLDDSLTILNELEETKEKCDLIFRDINKLRQSSFEYRWLDHVKNLVENSKNADELVSVLLNGYYEINGTRIPNIRMIERLSKKLAIELRSYKSVKSKDAEAIAIIQKLASSVQIVMANIDIMIEKAQELENDASDDVKEKGLIILRLLQEIKFLEVAISDLEEWGNKLMQGIGFFGKRIRLYTMGGISSDNKNFIGFKKFGDKITIQSVLGNEDVKSLLGQSSILDQIQYLSALISFLQRDVDIKQGIWLQNVSTKKFYENLGKHASAFADSYSNKNFAERLLQKKSIGEEPFAWMQFLNELRLELTREIEPQTSGIVEKAQKSLIVIFKERQQYLKKLIGLGCSRISEALEKYGPGKDILKAIKKRIKEIGRALDRLWTERVAKFLKIQGRIKVITLNVEPEIGRVLQYIDYKSGMDKIMERSRYYIKFEKHRRKVLKLAKRLDSSSMLYLFMGNFDLARMEEFVKESQIVESLLIEKTKSFSRYNILPLRAAIGNLVQLYSVLLEWLIQLGLFIEFTNLKHVQSRLIQFRTASSLEEQKITSLQAKAKLN